MAEAVLFNIAEALLKNLGSKALEEIASAWGFKAKLEKLKNTTNTIKDVLLDAEQKREESHAVRGWLERLRAVVFEADDLFDEFATVALQKEGIAGNQITKQVLLFFSHSNQLAFAWKMSRKIKKIRKRLDEIAKDGDKFAFRLHRDEDRAGSWRREQTYSFVNAEDVIGRDDDKKAVMDMILDASVEENVSVISIVGIGGLGKTTLAQFIYNDEKIVKHFERRLWICVSDVFDIKVIIEKILMSATKVKPDNLEIDQLQSQLREEIGGKKYLLVLDDVWNENRDEWLKLRAFLMVGGAGSKILLTTRSKVVAEKAADIPPYELKGLSDDKSWSLFEKMVFKPGQQQKNSNLVEVGKQIVKRCANVPLAIRTLGTLLRGEDESKWLAFKDNEVPKIVESGNNIMNILKLSYHHLLSPLKNCFAYCALFPKDFEMDKETLISLWMAEGFIVPSYESQSLEEAGEVYFMTLLQRCFFQDIARDELGNIAKCKMHDLMHDLAQEVAGAECALTESAERDIDKRAHHLSFGYCLKSSSEFRGSLWKLKNLRTFLLPVQWVHETEFSRSLCNQIISSFECLRVLDLHNLGIESLPSSIGKLVHLRYLDLSSLPIKELPVSITNLQNLETLKLIDCFELTKLPMNMKKLINLRHLDVSWCDSLTHMPSGMGTLTALHKLSPFIVGIRSSSASNFKSHTAQLRDLNALNNLRGELHILFFGELEDPVSEAREEHLRSKCGISELHIESDAQNYFSSINHKHDETLLDGLQPHPNLRKLKISSYRGERLPYWASMDDLSSSLPNLVELELSDCGRCQYLPSFSQLPFLKRLRLVSLESVMYMESGCCKPTSSLSSTAALFFPSLEELTLHFMANLKGWWKDATATTSKDHGTVSSMEAIEQWQKHLPWPSFPKLSKLSIESCPNLMAMPLCPNVRELTLVNVNENFSVQTMMVDPVSFSAADLPSSSTSYSLALSKLDSLCVDNVDILINLPRECLQNFTSLDLQDHNLLNLSTLGDVFRSLSFLKSLHIYGCQRLRSLSGGLEYLTSLKELVIWNCEELDLSADGMPGDGMPWKALKSLQSLKFYMIPKMSVLPDGLQHITTLHSLFISYNDELTTIPEWISRMMSLESVFLFNCPRLTSLPEGIRFLASLKQLNIVGCQGLTDRCSGPRGDDWLKIQHIPVVSVRRTWLD